MNEFSYLSLALNDEQCSETHPPVTPQEALSILSTKVAEQMSIIYAVSGAIAPRDLIPLCVANGILIGSAIERMLPKLAERLLSFAHPHDRDEFLGNVKLSIEHQIPLIPAEFTDAFS